MSTLTDTLKILEKASNEMEKFATLTDWASAEILEADKAAAIFGKSIKGVGGNLKSAGSQLGSFISLGAKMSKSFKASGMVKSFSKIESAVSDANGATKNLNKSLQTLGKETKSSLAGIGKLAKSSRSIKPIKLVESIKSIDSVQPHSPIAESAETGKKTPLSRITDFFNPDFVGKLKGGMHLVDDYVNTQTRLKAVNDGSQSDAALQKDVFASANRSRSSYADTVNTFTNLQTSAGNAFGSNRETLGFAELMQKSFKLGGADSTAQSAGIDQVVQSMGSGKIESGDFDAITSSAPMMLQAMETFTGKSKAELRSMADQGTLTSDILKNSMFAASDDINNKFSGMPMTFEDVWKRIKNAGIQAFGGLMEGVNKVLNSAGVQTFIGAVVLGIYAAGHVVDWIIDKFSYIAPILEVIAGVLLASLVPILLDVAATAAKTGWEMASKFLLASWPLILIVSTIVIVIYALSSLGVTVQDVFSFIGGMIGVLAAVFFNYFVHIWNFVAAFVNFFGNVFKNPIAAVQALFFDLASNIIGYIATAAKGIEDLINKIPGVKIDITGGLDGLQKKLKLASEGVKDKAGLEDSMKQMDFKDYSEAATGGANMGGKLYSFFNDKISGFSKGFNPDFMGGAAGNKDLGTSNNPMTVQGAGSNGNLGVDMAEEDIQYLRDIAERDYINKFSSRTLAPNIQVTFGDVHQEADADQMAGRIQKILQEQIAVASEGVY